MRIEFAGIRLDIPQFTIRGEHRLRLDTVHSSLTSCLYKLIKRSRARIKRIFTADELMLSTWAISAQESPSVSYSQRQMAYLGGNCSNTRFTISRSATLFSKRPPS